MAKLSVEPHDILYHRVSLLYPRQESTDRVVAMIEWAKDPAIPGVFEWRWDGGGNESVSFMFSDANVALEFKMRWA